MENQTSGKIGVGGGWWCVHSSVDLRMDAHEDPGTLRSLPWYRATLPVPPESPGVPSLRTSPSGRPPAEERRTWSRRWRRLWTLVCPSPFCCTLFPYTLITVRPFSPVLFLSRVSLLLFPCCLVVYRYFSSPSLHHRSTPPYRVVRELFITSSFTNSVVFLLCIFCY